MLLSWMLSACSAADAKPEPVVDSPIEVGVVTLRAEPIALQTELSGRTMAYRSAEVRPQVTGIIKSREFREGANVKAGEVLYVLDPSVYRAAHAKAQAELASAEASLVTTQVRADRYADLVKINAVSKQEFDDARAAHQQALAAVAQGRASLESAKINLDYTKVVASISGRIGRSSVTQGALVTASQSAPLATIQQLDPIYVDVTQSSAQLLRLKRLLASGGALPPSAKVDLMLEDGTQYDEVGELQFTDVTVDASTGSVTLRALFPNPEGLLLPGMYVRAVIDEAMDPHAVLAPQPAITRDERGRAIALLVDAQDRVQLRTLTTGRAIGNRWLVTSGLSAGDRVIVEGNDKVKPGARVKPVAAKSSAPAGS
ncbi:MAG TPA: efflux RND transporter periplasmic adaptor subunit [Polyangiales bacterium]|nr:efflux RND transporter periplasmic adaptor subunit [Polyangiales bacterium]